VVKQGTAPSSGWKSVAQLILVTLAVAALLAITISETRQRIRHNEAAQTIKVIGLVVPAGLYDNDPGLDRLMVLAPDVLGSDVPVPVYRARLKGKPVAAVITVIARQGYVGPIRFLVAVGVDGRVIAARAIAHRETPGLGDRIDAAKSDWMNGFAGHSAGDPPAEQWAVRRDGGDFDQLTGATITSRAAVEAVRDAVLYFQQHRDEIFARSPE
jgi:electron transport complex protein RnfG